MSGPIDAVLCLHNAFRRDIFEIDDTVYKVTRGGGDLTHVLDRFHIMGEILDYHAKGEEEAVFPAVDKVAPLITKTYVIDHRELDRMVSGLEVIRKAPDGLTAARATAVLNAHLRLHLDKEDAYLYPILREQMSEDEQASIVGRMAGKVPPSRNPTLVHWLFPLLNHDDRVTVTRVWMTLMPPQVFAGFKPLIREAVAGEWVELKRQIPELE
ncbi:MAG: hemerythrin domain-containing protein [Nitrososphaeria archaeon]|jgi:hemerythrin-like domain-containing protein